MISPLVYLVLADGGITLDDVMLYVAPVAFFVKFGGYYLAAAFLARQYPEVETKVPFLAAWRTITGFLCGGLYYLVILHPQPDPDVRLPYLGLIPLRLAEWAFLLWIFYFRHLGPAGASRFRVHLLLGTLWSCVLDLVTAILVVMIFGALVAVL